eukprot:CAMPEP_0119551688 /NCGR_PEP_ID=MMETSP1352-20130426/4873_1 /TAXON_ID=265584 /ORGANISM="Stauroneis constricta, Strain CCMP1120" /LENGTH=1046 /DNA_ID=CAMNT_0007597789 /DNA_START=65 /DNA_END=3205 /DNA_ORIENTATION=+
MADEDLYDEFGNYVGPDLDSSDEEDDSDNEEVEQPDAPDDGSDVSGEYGGDEGGGAMVIAEDGEDAADDAAEPMNSIVLHEDKEHYPSAGEVYGEDVRTAVLDEDAMDLETPLVEPVVNKTNRATSSLVSDDDWIYSEEYLTTVLVSNDTSRTRRGVALIGHFHHGKTCFVDSLLEKTMRKPWGPRASLNVDEGGGPRYTDIYKSEQERQMSLVSTPISTLLSDTRGKNYCITMLDCPGHPNFHDETVAALRCVDGAVVCVDAVEGIMMHTEMAVRQAITEGLPICLVITKMDRLIVELKLPPRDCYYKLLHLVESMNELIGSSSRGRYPKLNPQSGNVAFSSAQHGWLFTLESFAQIYVDHQTDDLVSLGNNLPVDELGKRLWGDCYMDPVKRTFHDSPRRCSVKGVERTFVAFILEPLYKIYTTCLGEQESDVNKVLRGLGILLKREQLRTSSRPLLRTALSKFFETASCGYVDMLVKHIPSPAAAAKGKVARCYTGSSQSKHAKAMVESDPKGPLMIQSTKMYSTPDGNSFYTLGRIYSGTIKPGDRVKVLGEAYSPQDDEDMAVTTVGSVSIPRGRNRTDVTAAGPGNWVFLEGVDSNIAKTATITHAGDESGVADDEDEVYGDDAVQIFAPLKFPQAGDESVMKLAIEPLNPAELPKMVEGLRRVSKAYPMLRTRVEESGEHVIFGTGELYMDCVMHDLREVYADVEVKVADPIVAFRETVVETSSIKCFAETANKRNKLTFIAEPLDEGLAERLEADKVNLDWDKRKLSRFFQSQYSWDLLASRSIWAFGDSPTRGTNILMDDTLPSEVDKGLLSSCKNSIVQGFRWATREGPLCEEPVRATKLKILDVTLADKPIHRGGGQIIPAARRTVHSSLLTATPRLMEPIYRLQMQCPGEIVNSIQGVLKKRRGQIVHDRPIPGTLLYNVRGYVPVLDSFGFETDLRTFTQGQAMVYSVFDHWGVVPGDPLDKNIILHPLEPSPPKALARELLLKTRRRKGLSEDVSINKFFDDAMKDQIQTSAAPIIINNDNTNIPIVDPMES